jgi:hypothetical protein
MHAIQCSRWRTMAESQNSDIFDHGGKPKTATDIHHGRYLTALMQYQNETGSSKLQTSFKDQSWVIVYICFYTLCDFKT